MALKLESRRLGRWHVSGVEAGRGVPIVFLHGSGDTAFAWKSVLERVAVDHRVYAVDFGSTTHVDEQEGARLEADLDLLERVLATFDQPAHLVAHSYGALLALRYELRSSGRLVSLCLTEPIAFGLLRDDGEQRGAARLVVPVLEEFFDTWKRGEQRAAIEIILDYWNGRGSWQAMPEAHRARILTGGERFHAEVTCAYNDRTSASDARSVDVPTLVASGEHTTDAALGVCDLLARTIPRARALRVPGAGHSPMRSHPAEFTDAVLELVASAGEVGRA